MKKFIRKIFNILYPKQTKGASILMYHSVGVNNAFFTVDPKDFEKQINFLASSGFKIVTASALIKKYLNKENLSGNVCLTFDDGYLDNLENVLPVLKKYDIKATMFIAPKLLDSKFKTSDGVELNIFSLEDIKRVDAFSNFEFLPHSFSHRELTKISSEEIKEELRESFDYLNSLNVVEKILAYPRGKHSPKVVNVLKEENWSAAFTTEPGLLTEKTDKFLIPRNFVGRHTSFSEFKTLFSDGIYYYAKLKLWYTNLLKKF